MFTFRIHFLMQISYNELKKIFNTKVEKIKVEFLTGLYLCILSHADPSIAIMNWGDENIVRDGTKSEFLLRVRGGGLIISGDMKYSILFSVSFCVQSGKALIHN